MENAIKNVIEIVGISKTYTIGGQIKIRALRDVSFTIARGEFVAIMGASGSGKSTLMNLIGCLDRPTGGHYLLEGVDVASLAEEELASIRSRRIGFVFQNFNLLSRTSTLENVELPLFYSGWPDDGAERAKSLVEMVGLNGRERNHPSQLSGGQQQRVAIARALINQPAILLADEPTGNLDSANSAEILEMMTRLNRESGLTIIVVTHDAEVAAYAGRVITFRDGVIVSDTRNDHAALEQPPQSSLPPPATADEVQAALRGDRENALTFAVMALTAAARAINRNKLRAALTMLGIFIGVAAVIAMVAVGDGARYSVQQQIQSLGTNLLVIQPGATTSSGVRAGFGSTSTLRVSDAEAIGKEVGGTEAVSYMDRQIAQVVNGNRNWSTTIEGTTRSAYLDIRGIGNRRWASAAFTDNETRSAAPVCLLGQTVVNNVFAPGEDPVGVIIRVKSFPLRVVGVLESKGQSSYGQDQDDVVLTPFYTAERKVLGNSQVSSSVSSTTGNGSSNPVLNPYAGVLTTNVQV